MLFGPVHHCSGKIARKNNGENKSILHRQNGLRLARMTSAVVSNREREFRRTCEALPLAARAVCGVLDFECSSRGRTATPWVVENGGGVPPAPHFSKKQNEQFFTKPRSADLFWKRPARSAGGGGCVDSGKTSPCGRCPFSHQMLRKEADRRYFSTTPRSAAKAARRVRRL